MDFQILDELFSIINRHIDKNIFASVKVEAKVYDGIQISDAYIRGELVLRTRVMKIDRDENYFVAKDLGNIEAADVMPFWGLYIVKHMLRSAEKSKNEVYEGHVKDILTKFIAAVERAPEKLTATEAAAFNRALVFCYAYAWFVKKGDPFAEKLHDFMKTRLLETLDIGDRSSYTFRASMCSARLLVAVLLSVDNIADCIEKMLRCTSRYLNQDGTSSDGVIQTNAYFNRFFSLFMDVLKLTGVKDDRLSERYSAQVRFLQMATSANGFFPAIGSGNSVRSAFSPEQGNQVFSNSGVHIVKNEDAFWIGRAAQEGASVFFEHGGKAVFLEHGLQQGQPVFSGLQVIRKENGELSAANVIFGKHSVSIEMNTRKCRLSAGYLYENIESGFKCQCDYQGMPDGMKHVFVLSSQSKEVQFSRDTVTFFSGGKHVSLLVRSEENFSVSFQNGICTEEGETASTQIVEICFPAESGQFEIDVCIDRQEYSQYKQSREEFLPERAYRQVKSIAYSDIMDQLIRNGNIGATEIYRLGRQAYLEHDFETSKRCEIMNNVLHNCVIKSSCRLGKGTRLAYGGVGVLIHAQSATGKNCMIGVGASLANAATMGDYVYVSPGARFAKKIHVGSFSIIGANAVINKDVEPFSIVAGVPAKVIGKVTPENVEKYLVDYFAATDKTNDEFVAAVRQEFKAQYEQYERAR